MSGSVTSIFRRIAAAVVGLTMIAVILFSAFYIAAEADHDCTGEDCQICACIQQFEDILRFIGSGIILQSSVMLRMAAVALTALLLIAAVSADTPVSRKVRLNN